MLRQYWFLIKRCEFFKWLLNFDFKKVNVMQDSIITKYTVEAYMIHCCNYWIIISCNFFPFVIFILIKCSKINLKQHNRSILTLLLWNKNVISPWRATNYSTGQKSWDISHFFMFCLENGRSMQWFIEQNSVPIINRMGTECKVKTPVRTLLQ